MIRRSSDKFKHICLLSLPWPLFKRPSIQLGSLKSFLNRDLRGTRVDTAHIYLYVAHHIGYDVYQAISKRTWLAESVYAALLYPEKSEAIERFFRKQTSRNQVLKSIDFEVLVRQVKDITDETLRKMDWHGIGLAGFSAFWLGGYLWTPVAHFTVIGLVLLLTILFFAPFVFLRPFFFSVAVSPR